MSEEHKIYIPIRGTYVEPPPVYKYSARWYEEQGLKMPSDTRLKKFARWIHRMGRRAGIEFYREDDERCLRLGRLFISWYDK